MIKKSILLVDDDQRLRELLKDYLNEKNFRVFTSADFDEAKVILGFFIFDLIILDRMMPTGDGINLIQDIKKVSKTPIIMLTAKSEEDNKIMGLNSGIDDYLTKPFSPKELIARINALLRRSSPELTDEPVNILDLSLDPLQHQLTIKGKLIKIGPTEFKILHLFIKNLNKVFSRNQIMDRVWGNKSEIDDRTVDVHIKRIRACLANDGYDKIIRTIRGEGYSVSEKHL